MGIVLGVEAAVCIFEAAETAGAVAEASEGIAAGAEAAETITSGTEAGIEAGTEAGTEASTAVAEGGDALATALEKLTEALQKLSKMVAEFIIIDQTFKAAKAIIEAITNDPAARARAEKLEVLVSVLTESSTIIEDVNKWFQAHVKDTTTLNGIEIPVDQGVLAKFLSPLGAAAKTLQALSKKVSEKNFKKDAITDGEVDALQKGLTTVLGALLSLAQFKEAQSSKVQVLGSLPISTGEVSDLQAKIN